MNPRIGAVVLVSILAAAACIPPRPSPSVEGSPLDATPSPSPVVSDAASPTAGGSAPPTSGVVVDPTLLEHLPADIAGVPRTPDDETAAEIAGQPLLDTFLSNVAVAIYPANPDYAVATVSRVRPDVFDEGWFRDYRDTFDEGVCSQAGGVETGRSEMELGGRPVHRSACKGGVVIYHVWLPDSGTVVSVQGAGPLDLGRSIVSGLTE